MDDIRAGRVRKASFVSLFTEEEEQAQELIQALQMCQLRMEIDLYGAYLGEKGTDLLCDFLSNPKCCVERLNIQKLRVNREEFCKLWQSIGKNKSLKYLKVTAYPWDVWTIMGEALQKNISLKQLDTGDCFPSPTEMNGLVKGLVANQSITSFSMCHEILEDEETQVFAKVLKENHTLQCLTTRIYACSLGGRLVFESLEANSTIRILNLTNSYFEIDGCKYISQMLKSNKTIIELYLKGSNLMHGGGEVLCEGLKVNSTLTLLDLCRNSLGPKDGVALGDMLKHNHTLKTLCLDLNGLGQDGLLGLADGVQVNRSLRKLSVSHSFSSIGQIFGTLVSGNLLELDVSYSNVGDNLAFKTHLHTLRLSGVCLGKMNGIAESIKLNPSLKVLDLSKNPVDARVLCEALHESGSLEVIILNSTQLGPSGCKEVAKMLQVNRSLKRIDLSLNQVGSVAAAELFEALLFNHTLQTLEIGDNRLDDACVSSMCNLIEKNSSLTHLDVSLNVFNDSKRIIEAITKSSSLLAVNFFNLETNALSEALLANTNLSSIECFMDVKVASLSLRNNHLRESRVESSVATLILLKKKLVNVPKEVFLMIGKFLLNTKDDPFAWRSK